MDLATNLLKAEQSEAFANLFLGSLAAIGSEQGGCVYLPDDATYFDFQDLCHEHLWGDTPIGVYPQYLHGGETLCHWGCVDFDEGDIDSRVHASNLQAVLNELSITGWHEISRSKGSHCWVFSDSAVPAATMRQALMAACQLVDAPTREVNPKQAVLTEGQVGNYVRLPYPNNWQDTNRRCMVTPSGNPWPFLAFIRTAAETRATLDVLETAASLYKPPAPPAVAAPQRQQFRTDISYGETPPIIAHMLTHGPFEAEQDRSAWLWKFCRRMAEKGVPYPTARTLLDEADQRWGKFHQRRDGSRHLDGMLAKAYGGQ
jgi:hypothetical protein